MLEHNRKFTRMSELWKWQRLALTLAQADGALNDLTRCSMGDSPNAVATALMTLAGEVRGRAVLKTQSWGTVPLVFNAMYSTAAASRPLEREQIPGKAFTQVCVFGDAGSTLEIKLSPEAEAMAEGYATHIEGSAISFGAHPLVISYLAQSRLTICAIAGLVHLWAGRDGVLSADTMLEAISCFDMLFEAFEQAVMPFFWPAGVGNMSVAAAADKWHSGATA